LKYNSYANLIIIIAIKNLGNFCYNNNIILLHGVVNLIPLYKLGGNLQPVDVHIAAYKIHIYFKEIKQLKIAIFEGEKLEDDQKPQNP